MGSGELSLDLGKQLAWLCCVADLVILDCLADYPINKATAATEWRSWFGGQDLLVAWIAAGGLLGVTDPAARPLGR